MWNIDTRRPVTYVITVITEINEVDASQTGQVHDAVHYVIAWRHVIAVIDIQTGTCADVIVQDDVSTMTYRSSETTHVENQPPSIIIVVDVVDLLIHPSHVATGPPSSSVACHINSVACSRARNPATCNRCTSVTRIVMSSSPPCSRMTDTLTVSSL